MLNIDDNLGSGAEHTLPVGRMHAKPQLLQRGEEGLKPPHMEEWGCYRFIEERG